jgi:hypothetical protein
MGALSILCGECPTGFDGDIALKNLDISAAVRKELLATEMRAFMDSKKVNPRSGTECPSL